MFDNNCKKPDSIVSVFMKLCLLTNIINIILSIFSVITHNTNNKCNYTAKNKETNLPLTQIQQITHSSVR